MFNPISARILLAFQVLLFFGGLTGMIWLLHALPDGTEYAAQLEQRAERLP